jgi:Icc-related predicted phosphoesterase
MEIIEEAYRMKNEEMLFSRWVASYQDQFSFEQFKGKIGVSSTPKQDIREKTEEEILEEVRGILNGNI